MGMDCGFAKTTYMSQAGGYYVCKHPLCKKVRCCDSNCPLKLPEVNVEQNLDTTGFFKDGKVVSTCAEDTYEQDELLF